MTTKYANDTTKDLTKLLKQLSTDVPDTSNSAEYIKFLQKTLEKARTFDKTSPEYVDYVNKSVKSKEPPKKFVPKSVHSVVVVTEKTEKRKPETSDGEKTKTKKPKIAVAPK